MIENNVGLPRKVTVTWFVSRLDEYYLLDWTGKRVEHLQNEYFIK